MSLPNLLIIIYSQFTFPKNPIYFPTPFAFHELTICHPCHVARSLTKLKRFNFRPRLFNGSYDSLKPLTARVSMRGTGILFALWWVKGIKTYTQLT